MSCVVTYFQQPMASVASEGCGYAVVFKPVFVFTEHGPNQKTHR